MKRLNVLFFIKTSRPVQTPAPALVQRDYSVNALRQAQGGLPYSNQGVVLEQWQAQLGTCLDDHP
jgi:hypothetical protein